MDEIPARGIQMVTAAPVESSLLDFAFLESSLLDFAFLESSLLDFAFVESSLLDCACRELQPSIGSALQ
ncbi:TPA: hypothetical protein ACXNQL_001717 [Stenotrophomonas maltophilia]